ncbi:MAG: SDR family oxidoreductase [Parcubacteria group bacterium]|nr:SDR family oxidoreductase [Parcubacteria group bacterium]
MNNLFDIQSKVIIITGGSGFLGTQYRASLEAAGAVIENFDVDTGVDVTDEASVVRAVEKVKEKHGHIDGLVTNAAANPKVDEGGAGGPWAPYSDFSPDLFRKEVDLNLTGSFIVAKAVSKIMVEQKSGSIVFISSDLGIIGPTNSLYDSGKYKDIAYGASKAGVLGLMRFFAAYLGAYGVRANALVPGGMMRGHSPEFAKRNGALNMLGRMSREGEYNGAVQFLLSDASSYMTGASLVIDGGRTAW